MDRIRVQFRILYLNRLYGHCGHGHCCLMEDIYAAAGRGIDQSVRRRIIYQGSYSVFVSSHQVLGGGTRSLYFCLGSHNIHSQDRPSVHKSNQLVSLPT